MRLFYGGLSDVGFSRDVNEDSCFVEELNPSDEQTQRGIPRMYFCAVLDGMGSVGTTYQPATLARMEAQRYVRRFYDEQPEILMQYPGFVLKEAMIAGGRVLSCFKVANEELYNGYGASMTCGLVIDNKITIVHCGNTRASLIRLNPSDGIIRLRSLTRDQTEGQDLVDSGKMDPMEYYISEERLKLTSCLGEIANPEIQIVNLTVRANDMVLFTSDGIHCAIRPDVIIEIVRRCETCEEAAKSLIDAAKIEEYVDNMSALLLWFVE